ncbi:sulfurtransferase TusA family protein [Mesorhizobium sp.]|uniref:sulfurtransferase TusA family protein n=1 Tax=Mesorhizobium sp. TaxID=1871066 RepID=UPI000FEA7801|nr:sulfurtransferase TusA family protein [Mesorhizobium sp.]RWA97441.1 MAG: sulfurtransferase TusA family protein [Mesorhizobium sp.]
MTASSAESKVSQIVEVDARGLNCPLPVLRARRAARALKPGSEVLIRCTDPLARIDIPHFAQTDKHTLVASGEDEDAIWFLLKIGV